MINIEELTTIKKKGNVEKLVPVMPENKKHFWINLLVSVTSEDLVDEMGLDSDAYLLRLKSINKIQFVFQVISMMLSWRPDLLYFDDVQLFIIYLFNMRGVALRMLIGVQKKKNEVLIK
ncbi:Uncharacterized protein FWK35_00014521 [Aphis craccivora]|uniref:Uncharacterized protein n=1 Tax=Aphis craccivora TaxID=307492 RepID=A0A6G0YDN5_APHCR|nr:Uncharacterized protein FWK35_00014521 [Aphis craccivora]